MEQMVTPIEEIIAGFIVWLARERVEVDRRHRCPGLAREFLLWQREQRERQRSSGLEDYLSRRGTNGPRSTDDQLKDAVQMLSRYFAKRN